MFYDNYIKLCAKMGKSPSGVAKEIGLSNAAANGWKKGKLPNETTLYKLSNYFGVPVTELTGENQEKPPAQGGGTMYPEWYGKLTPEETEQVRKYAYFLISERHKDQP